MADTSLLWTQMVVEVGFGLGLRTEVVKAILAGGAIDLDVAGELAKRLSQKYKRMLFFDASGPKYEVTLKSLYHDFKRSLEG